MNTFVTSVRMMCEYGSICSVVKVACPSLETIGVAAEMDIAEIPDSAARPLLHRLREAERREIDALRKRSRRDHLPRESVVDVQNRGRVERVDAIQRNVVLVLSS